MWKADLWDSPKLGPQAGHGDLAHLVGPHPDLAPDGVIKPEASLFNLQFNLHAAQEHVSLLHSSVMQTSPIKHVAHFVISVMHASPSQAC